MTQPRIQLLKQSNLRPAPVEDENTEIVAMGPATSGAACVYLWQDLLRALIEAAQAKPNSTQVALLLGRLSVDVGTIVVEIRGYIELETYDTLTDFCRATNDYWSVLQNKVDRREDGLRIFGWACLQSGDRGELTRVHQVTHRSFFNYPHQVFLQIDPSSQNVALYGFDENGRLVHIGFHLVRPRPAV